MTISSTTSKSTYTSGGSDPHFDVGFYFEDELDLVVIATTSGVEAVLTLGATADASHYTVTGEGTTTGTIVPGAAIAAGVIVTIERGVALKQLTSLKNQAAFYEEVHEGLADRLLCQIQQMQRQLDVFRPRRVTQASAPTALATAGRDGEIVYFVTQKQYYGKTTTTATDTNWVLLG
jgi:hypothetical protein